MMLVLVMSMGMAACSDDDNDGGGSGGKGDGGKETSIVGTWKHSFSTGYILLILRPDGTGVWNEYDSDDGVWFDPSEFTYTYNEKSGILRIRVDGVTETWYVDRLTSSTLVLSDEYGDSDTFTRQ